MRVRDLQRGGVLGVPRFWRFHPNQRVITTIGRYRLCDDNMVELVRLGIWAFNLYSASFTFRRSLGEWCRCRGRFSGGWAPSEIERKADGIRIDLLQSPGSVPMGREWAGG